MIGSTKWEKGTTAQLLNWIERVHNPAQKGYFREAYSNADSLIDSEINLLLRQVYPGFDEQGLISQIEAQRTYTNFAGLTISLVLVSVGAIDDAMLDKIRKFKKARNLVLHSLEGEYALVIGNPNIEYQNFSTKEMDNKVTEEAQRWLKVGNEIWDGLLAVSKNLTKERVGELKSIPFIQKNAEKRRKAKKAIYPHD